MQEIRINGLRLLNFSDLNTQQIKMVYEWRNDPRIAEFMINKSVKWDEHLSFIAGLKDISNKRYFLVFRGDEPIGVISFIDICGSSCEFGIYASPNVRGVGNLLMQSIISYTKDILGVSSLKARAFVNNTRAKDLYKKFGFKIYQNDDKFYYLILEFKGQE